MYPNPELLSAHLDKEVPGPWDGMIAQAIEADPGTFAEYDRFRRLQTAVRSLPGPDVDEAKDRVYRAVVARTAMHSRRPIPIWRRRVPVTVAAAAGVVAAMLGALVVYAVTAAQGPAGLQMSDEGRIDVTINVDDEGLEEVIRWLNARNEIGQVSIELPETPRFQFQGEPTLMRSSDFNAFIDEGGGIE